MSHTPKAPSVKTELVFNGRLGTVARMDYREVSCNGYAGDGFWDEVAMSDCPLGCKAYRNQETNEIIVWHNSNYNCRR
jgi:hypothetical protein